MIGKDYSVFVVDNFLADPDKMRQSALLALALGGPARVPSALRSSKV
jgi:hypothetical protein